MGEYKSLTASECAKRIEEIEKPIIAMHARPDGDTAGGCAALINIFSQLGKEARYICQDAVPKRLEFILDGCNSADLSELGECNIIAVDVASEAQLGSIWKKIPAPVLMIDHHEIGSPFSDNFIIPGASSAAEVVMQLAEELIALGRISMTEELASALYAGISSDTSGFRYSSTSPETMRRAAELMSMGINHSDINHKLFTTKSHAQLAAEGFVAGSILTAEDGKIAYSTVTLDDAKRLGADMTDFETAIDVIRSLEGVQIAFVVKDLGNCSFRVSIRSLGADVASIASLFGGGGHIRAAGCRVCAESAAEAASAVLEKIKQAHFFSHG